MTTKYKTKGFILKKNERAESDQTFTVFTKDFGKLEITAKAVRKITSKLRADIDIFYLSEIEFIQGKNNKTLTDAIKIKNFDNILTNSETLKIAYQISDIIDGFIKGQERDQALFDLLQEIFDRLSNNTAKIKNYQLVFQYFIWNFLSGQGYKPEVQKCILCESKLNPYNIYFSYKEGGIICKECLSSDKCAQKANSDIVKILRIILNRDWLTMSKLKIEPFSQELLTNISENAISNFCPA